MSASRCGTTGREIFRVVIKRFKLTIILNAGTTYQLEGSH